MHPPFRISTSNPNNFCVVATDWMNVHRPWFPTSRWCFVSIFGLLFSLWKIMVLGFSTGSTCVMSINSPCFADHHSKAMLGQSIRVQTNINTECGMVILTTMTAYSSKAVHWFLGCCICREMTFHTVSEIYTRLGPNYFCFAYQMQYSSFWQLMTSWRKELNRQGWNIMVMTRREETRVAMTFLFGNSS